MKQETYNELDEIVVKGAKDDYFTWEVMCGITAVGLVLALFLMFGNIPAMLIIATGIIVFIVAYLPSDITMMKKVEARQELMDEVKQDVV